MKYTKLKSVVDAFRLPERGNDDVEPFLKWCHDIGFDKFESGRDETLIILNKDGINEIVQPGEWIVKDGARVYAMTAEDFSKTFEEHDPWSELIPAELMEECWNRVRDIWKEEENNPNREAMWFVRCMNEFIIKKTDVNTPKREDLLPQFAYVLKIMVDRYGHLGASKEILDKYEARRKR